MIYEHLKNIIEKLYEEGKITDEEYKILIQSVDELKEEKGGGAMKN